MHVLKKFHKKIFSLTDFIKSLAKTAQKRQSKYIYACQILPQIKFYTKIYSSKI